MPKLAVHLPAIDRNIGRSLPFFYKVGHVNYINVRYWNDPFFSVWVSTDVFAPKSW